MPRKIDRVVGREKENTTIAERAPCAKPLSPKRKYYAFDRDQAETRKKILIIHRLASF